MSTQNEAKNDAARREREILVRLRNALSKDRLVLIVGAGVTLSATAKASGEPLSRATWRGLIENGLNYLVTEQYVDESELRIEFARRSLETGKTDSMLDAADIVMKLLEQHQQLPTWLDAVFASLHQEVRHPAVLEVLKSLHDKGAILLTTNYDDLLERSCRLNRIGRSDLDNILKFKRGDLDGVFHLHGSYHDPDEVVLDTKGYYQVGRSEEVRNLLKEFLDSKIILFVGCGSGLEDPHFDELLKWASERHKNVADRHYMLLRKSDALNYPPLLRLRYGESYQDLAPYLSKLLSDPTPAANSMGNASDQGPRE